MRRMPPGTLTGRTRVAVPRRTATPRVPAARKSAEALPAPANPSLETLEYAS
ncbi:hypothetical protein LJ657_05285 [Streptomyces sp. NR30]|uniref:Uncharacterized protein n=1 Tax=Streptomyces guryensis TaxID=2886947 RepID=A0A9Q3Z494_9ACTN|nr:hypothetical protein [Streptomyces guryensis]